MVQLGGEAGKANGNKTEEAVLEPCAPGRCSVLPLLLFHHKGERCAPLVYALWLKIAFPGWDCSASSCSTLFFCCAL